MDACEAVLASVRSRYGDGAEAEVTASSGRSALTRFANSHIHQNMADDHVGLRLRLVLDGRVATAATGRLGGGGLERLVATAGEIARWRRPDPAWPGVAGVVECPDPGHYDAASHRADPAVRAGVAARFISAADDLEAAGFCSTAGSEVAFANTAGQAVTGRRSRAQVEGIHRGGGADGGAANTAVAVEALDGGAVGDMAAGRARLGIDPVAVEPGSYEVVLMPAAVADVVDFLSGGFNAKHHGEGQSFVELGRAQFDPSINLFDDATDARALGLGFDAEGTPRRRLDLVTDGVAANLVHDRRTATAAGVVSTGHAVAGGETAGPNAGHVFLEAGRQPVEAMIASMGRGLVVTQLWYTRILDPKTQVVTGLTRNGTFLVVDGRVTAGVANLRFTQSYLHALGPGNVLGVGSEGELAGENDAWVPALHLARWNFTGGRDG